jgi:double-stranded uracil-DNA glycosylase
MTRRRTLPDYIRPDLRVLFIGINPGLRSAQVGHHFAGPSNRFWKLLYESRLVNEALTYREDWRLPEWGLGLTNIISRSSAGIDVLKPREYRAGVARLKRKVDRYRPMMVAFLGVTIFRTIFLPGTRTPSRLSLGLQRIRLAGVPVFLLPNPSGRNAHYSYRRMLAAFQALRHAAPQKGFPRPHPRPIKVAGDS